MDEDNKIISPEEADKLLAGLPGWQVTEGKIAKRFRFPSFPEAVEFVGEISPFFEAENHHPDIRISYDEILFELSTHEAGDQLTTKDFLVAGKIEEEYAAF